MEPVTPTLPDDDVAAIDRLGAIYKELSSELSKMIIGQQRVVELLSIALFSRGHALLMGVPGLAKTLLVSSVAKTLDLSFNRIQFTPDLMPADITGTDIIQDDSAGGKRQFEFIKGPVFANIVLADEISPDTCRFWDSKTGEKLDKDRFRRDLGHVEDAYQEILHRLMGGHEA